MEHKAALQTQKGLRLKFKDIRCKYGNSIDFFGHVTYIFWKWFRSTEIFIQSV